MEDIFNLYNKDIKYEKLSKYWKKQLELQQNMLTDVEDELRTLEIRHSNRTIEEQTLSDKSFAQAIEIRNLLKQFDQDNTLLRKNIQLFLCGKSAILAESKSNIQAIKYINPALIFP